MLLNPGKMISASQSLLSSLRKEKTLFIILGSSGKVASLLAAQLSNYNKKVVTIPFCNFQNEATFRESFKGGVLHSKSFYGLVSSFTNIIFIDCFICLTSYVDDLALHADIQQSVCDIFPASRYICLSTFEPDGSSCSLYRRHKSTLETLVLDKNGLILRIGYLVSHKSLLPSFRPNIAIKAPDACSLFIPITTDADLANHVISIASSSHITTGICKCYTSSEPLTVQIYPNCKLIFARPSIVLYCLPILRHSFFYLILTVAIYVSRNATFPVFRDLSIILQRLASLYEQQCKQVEYTSSKHA